MKRRYRLLLYFYPRWFRDRYGAEIVAACAAERQQADYTGWSGPLRFWLYILRDIGLSAGRMRLQPSRAAQSRKPKGSVMEGLWQEIRHAWRQLLRRPGFTAVAVVSLAIGIGGNAIIVALVDGFVLRPFAYPEPDRLVTVGVTFPRVSDEERFIEALSPLEFADIDTGRTLEPILAFDVGNRNISGGDRPERVLTGLALTDPFGPFKLSAALGRGFTADELAPGGPAAAILSYRLWRGQFGGDPSLVGSAVRINGRPTTVVGVMPPELLLLGVDLWIPWGIDPLSRPRNARQLTLIARLSPDATLAEANAELAAIAAQTAAAEGVQFEEYVGWRLTATPWVEALMRDIQPAARLLLGAVGLVLLIACANLSNLLLARSTTRQRELAVRVALGAGRSRIARQLLAEVALLAVAGLAGGLLLARVGLPFLVSLVPAQLNTLGVTATINARVVGWAALLTIGSAVLVALLPIYQSTRAHPQDALKSDGRSFTSGRAPLRLRHALIMTEIALSVVLLVGAGLMVRSFDKLQRVEPGFDPVNVLTMRITLPQEKYRGGAISDFFQRTVDSLEEMPGVNRSSFASQFPPQGPFSTVFRIDGIDAPATAMPTSLLTTISDKHFETLAVPTIAGRVFGRTDRANTPPVAVVNEAFVSRYLPGADPLGLRVRTGPADRPSPPIEIVGVVANTQNRGLRNPPAPEIFVPMHQELNNQMFLLVRTAGDAAAMLPTVRRAIASLDADQPIYSVQTLEEALAASTFRQRSPMVLFGVFAFVALALAALGIYGVMSYAVSARTQEIGVRLAVGADRGDMIWLILRQVVRLTAVGLAIGLAGVVAASTLIRGALFEVQPLDPMTIAGATAVLGTVALVAGWLPAWRASRLDPMTALRDE